MLKHGAWSRKWVKDVAVLLASRPQNFDWRLCEGPDAIRAGWVRAALVVAKELEGANLQGTPAEAHQIPTWLIPEIKKSQQHPNPEDDQRPESIWKAIIHPWRLPAGFKKALAESNNGGHRNRTLPTKKKEPAETRSATAQTC